MSYEREAVPPLAVHEPSLFGNSDVDVAQIEAGLRLLFARHRLVFWHDPDREFFETVDAVALDGVETIRMALASNEGEASSLAVKLRVDLDEPDRPFLLYAPFAVPPIESDFLLDLRFFSGTFSADRASLILDELGLGEQQALRPHIQSRLRFFGAKDRTTRLKRLLGGTETEANLDRKMIAVLARAEQAEPFSIFLALFGDLRPQGGLSGEPSAWGEMVRYGLTGAFWDLVEEQFGYREDLPKLRTLLLRLFATDFARSLTGVPPTALSGQMLPNRPNVGVFLSQWRDSSTRGAGYAALSVEVAKALKIDATLAPLSAESLQDVQTFFLVEQRIASDLAQRIADHPTTEDASKIRALVGRRQDGYWTNVALGDSEEAPRGAMSGAYRALLAALDLFLAVREFGASAPVQGAASLALAYVDGLSRIDTLYRWFIVGADVAQGASWGLIKDLRVQVEAAYTNGYLVPLGLAWGNALEGGLLEDWSLYGVPNQYEFFARRVEAPLAKETRRVFVVVSDALRYEAAKELAQELNGRYRFRTDLSPQLGVLPSITALGMAALLPHKKLSIGPGGEVLADGQSTSGMANRRRLLEAVGGVAVAADDLLRMKKEEGRAFVRDHRVVYVYHNAIDAAGDSQSTEGDTFAAVAQAIEELSSLVRHIVNTLNGSLVVVTADHGFLYLDEPPSEAERSESPAKGGEAFLAKKRYVLGRSLSGASAYHGSTDVTANTDSGTEFAVPKGINRFHFAGGSRYFHGGAMPQEVLVPVLEVRENEADRERPQPVAVHLLVGNTKVTTSRYRVQLIQTEAIGDRRTPETVRVGIYDGPTEVSSVETVTFDSASESMEERTRSVFLSLKSVPFERGKPYQLVVRRAEDGVEIQRIDLTVDLAFHNDF